MNIQAIKQANADAGAFFFSPDTMRGFSSRVHSATYKKSERITLFVTSEKFQGFRADGGPRVYSVRVFDALRPGSVAYLGGYSNPAKFESRHAAHAAARRATVADVYFGDAMDRAQIYNR